MQVVSSLQVFNRNIVYISRLCHACYMAYPSIPLELITRIIYNET